jgi:hypothetical protein
MSYQEKKSVTNIVSSILITGVYTLIMYQKYLSGSLDDSNIFKFWAIILLIFIPISIVARIIIMIFFHILEAIVQTAKGNEFDDQLEVEDERDKLIGMKASRVSMISFFLFFILAFITQLFNVSNHLFFITLILGGFLTDLISEILTIRYYRKGV